MHRATAALLSVAFLSGCAPQYDDLKAFVQARGHQVSSGAYRVDPPDGIKVSSPTAPEIDGQTQRLGVEGKITLPLLGEVKVSGMTPKEIATKLEDLLERYYVDPTVQVQVTGYASKKIYVFGEVGGRGSQPFTGRDTVLDVLARSQPTNLAWGSRVRVIRPSALEDERKRITVDIDKIMKTGDLTGNILLKDGDIVYVPPTPWAWVGLRMQDLLFPVSPVLGGYRTPKQFKQTNDGYRSESWSTDGG